MNLTKQQLKKWRKNRAEHKAWKRDQNMKNNTPSWKKTSHVSRLLASGILKRK